MNKQNKIKPTQVRKIKPTRISVSGIYPFRGESSVAYESTLERDFIIRAEFFPDVLEVIPQPVAIPFIANNGRQYTYTPDFLVYYRLDNCGYNKYPKPTLIEVKPEHEWKKHWREWMPKWKAAQRYAKKQGWKFHIHDETRIRDISFENIRFLERYKRMSFPNEEIQAVLNSVELMGVTTPDHLLAKHFMGIYRAEGISLIWHLIATYKLTCDMRLPIDYFSELWRPIHE